MGLFQWPFSTMSLCTSRWFRCLKTKIWLGIFSQPTSMKTSDFQISSRLTCKPTTTMSEWTNLPPSFKRFPQILVVIMASRDLLLDNSFLALLRFVYALNSIRTQFEDLKRDKLGDMEIIIKDANGFSVKFWPSTLER